MDVQLIDLDRMSTDGTRTRAGLREQAVAEYAQLIQEGVRLVPAVVFKDGERLTGADKAHNIKLVLRQKPAMSDSAIAELCGVSPTTVGKYRAELASTFQIGKSAARVGRDGRVYDTPNLRRSPRPARHRRRSDRGNRARPPSTSCRWSTRSCES